MQALNGIFVAGAPMPEFRRIEVDPLTGACGCEIRGIDCSRPLDPETLAQIMLAFEHFLVIVFRDRPELAWRTPHTPLVIRRVGDLIRWWRRTLGLHRRD